MLSYGSMNATTKNSPSSFSNSDCDCDCGLSDCVCVAPLTVNVEGPNGAEAVDVLGLRPEEYTVGLSVTDAMLAMDSAIDDLDDVREYENAGDDEREGMDLSQIFCW
jgi:hypothetical protein